MSEYVIERLTIPAAIDGSPDATAFQEMVEVRNRIEASLWGVDDYGYTAEELLAAWHDQDRPDADWPGRIWVVRDPATGRIVARAYLNWTVNGDDLDTAWLGIQVLPTHLGRGIGTTLADLVEREAAGLGRSKFLQWVPFAPFPAEAPRIVPPTGAGAAPADTPAVRLLLARGYRLEQIDRASRLRLPLDRAQVEALLAETAAIAGDDYRTITWEGAAPEERRADMAHLNTRMSTDAPSAGMETGEDPWDVDRFLEWEATQAEMGGIDVVTVVEHVPTGRLAGFTQFHLPPEHDRPIDQNDTIVLKEHRGHRLGLLLKLTNLLQLERHPEYTSIVTSNAEENRHMLDVNERIGFVAESYESGWRKDLSPRTR